MNTNRTASPDRRIDRLYLVVTGHFSVARFAGRFLVPTLASNVIGAVSLVAAVAHAQFVADEPAAR